jgi:peptidyl-prolyl cis-trans isomerase D
MAVMHRMRENTKTILMVLVVAFMLTIIIDWGMGGFKNRQPRGVIATVNGSEIHYEEFYKLYQSEIATYREERGSEPEGADLEQIENRVFDTLVQQRLLGSIISEMDLSATDDEIVEDIYNNPPPILKNEAAFKDSSGAFDRSKYEAALANPAADQFWNSVVSYLRSTVPIQKFGDMMNSTSIVTDDEARLYYEKNNLQAKIDYLFYSTSQFGRNAPEPTDEEIKAYYESNQKEFASPGKRILDYVLLELKPTAKDSQAVYKDAEQILQDAKSGQDFAELASLYSEDPGSAQKGGDLGFFGKGTMVKPFEEAAFAAKVGEIVGPVKTQFGLHIIKVEDRKTEKGEVQVKARHILLTFKPQPSTREALSEEANYVAEYAKESGLRTVAEAEKVNVEQTEPFTQGSFIPGIGMQRRINRFAFKNKKGATSDVFQIDRGFLVVSVAEVIPKRIEPLENVKPSIVAKLAADKKLEMAGAKAKEAYQKLQSGATFEDVAADDSLTIQSSDMLKMSGYITGIGREPEVAGKAFKLNVGDFSDPIKTMRGYYIIQLLEKTKFDEDAFQKQKDSIKKQLLHNKQASLFNNWYNQYREKANIKDYRGDYL